MTPILMRERMSSGFMTVEVVAQRHSKGNPKNNRRIDILPHAAHIGRMGKTKKQNYAGVFIAGFIGAVILAFAGMTGSQLHSSVKSICLIAKNEFKKDCVSSLIETVKSEKFLFRDRNRAIWALGQIADSKALPFLTELNRSLQDRKTDGEHGLSKFEVEKAIKWCMKGNLTSWMYRNRENWQ